MFPIPPIIEATMAFNRAGCPMEGSMSVSKETRTPAWVAVSIPSWIRNGEIETSGHLKLRGSHTFTPPTAQGLWRLSLESTCMLWVWAMA